MQGPFRSSLGYTMFQNKYQHAGAETWDRLAATCVEDVCRGKLHVTDKAELTQYIREMKFIPAGRYLYYAGRPIHTWNNCFLLRAEEDTREDWATLSWKVESCLSTGGGIGVDYSVYRAKGAPLKRTGGTASGPISKMIMTNEIGRQIMQGGSRRSAIYGSLDWQHADAKALLYVKDWKTQRIPGTDATLADAKAADFNWPAPLDMTNISLNYNNAWRDGERLNETFLANCRQAMETGEPGFSFNFDDKQYETLRNACTEVCSEDDSDCCNLGSINWSRIESLDEFIRVVRLASIFLVCGTLHADVPYAKVAKVREKNRRLGLGALGIHEWLLMRGARYEVTPEMHEWLAAYQYHSKNAADRFCDRLGISRPVAYRAIAPTGTIGLMAGTTTGIEPIYAVAIKRRYLKNGTDWHYQYKIDDTAQSLINLYGLDPDKIETSVDLAADYERRMKFQCDTQDYVDQAISSTINLPAWGTEMNNEGLVRDFATTLAHYAPRMRGFTAYPDGSRGGQPLTAVPYHEAANAAGVEFTEFDACKGGVCGI